MTPSILRILNLHFCTCAEGRCHIETGAAAERRRSRCCARGEGENRGGLVKERRHTHLDRARKVRDAVKRK
ncbi:hypothetical protein NQZ68_013923 [Dissostichus eleginoides]|nr:hypothetical protein NQZ68_013923 [Dissostichus eleginoides]